jgi:hypothetical protein
MFEIILSACVIACMGGLDFWRRKRAVKDLHSFEISMNRFYEAAMKLADMDEAPYELVELIEFLDEKTADPAAAPQLVHLLRQGRMSGRPSGETARRISTIHKFFETRRELKPIFVELASSAILAISFRSMVWGPVIRIWFSAVDTIERKEEVLFEYGRGNCPVAA